MATKVTSKGQITLPKWVRDALGVKPGGSVDFVLEKGHVHLLVAGPSVSASLAGSLKAYAKKHSPASERAMMEKMRREVANAAAVEGLPRRHKRSS
jgi:AbrB family looped-hinge helix DNA binding protein